MKLVSFQRDVSAGFGAVVGDGVIDLTGKLKGKPDLRHLLASDDFSEARELSERARPDFPLAECTFLPVVPAPSKIICLGLNYKSHAEEVGKPPPKHPVVFHRHAQTLIGHKQPLLRPVVSEQFDYEGELAVVIGRGGGHIAERDAMSHVAGYSIFNESSVRDWQRHSHIYGMGKNFRASGAFGPWLVTRDEFPDPAVFKLRTLLNGEEVQRCTLDDLIFSIPHLICYVSQAIDWLPGDVLVTGTPGGVGLFRKPPRFLRAGDIVEVEVSGIGRLVNPVVDET